MNLERAIFLFSAGILGGMLNAVAGGGSFLGFPALLFTGVPPIPANATNTVALWAGVTASGGAYRNRLEVSRRVMGPLLFSSCMGGIAGALLLLKTPPHIFMRVLPWLMLGATLLFIFGNRLAGDRASRVGNEAAASAIFAASIFEIAVALYGGYFGGGVGIVNLAMFAAMGITDIHAMNALKSVLGSMINGVAVVVFIISRAVYWPQAGVMIAGSVLGGYFGAHYAQKLPHHWIRRTVILVGASMTIYFFARAY
ncbi:MAG: sulfite exporter TauE/SafE family protein [Terriglobales bacterium]